MEILKRISLGVSLIMVVSVSHAQDDAVRLAFRSSYASEAQNKFSKAIEEITKVYIPSSYELNLRLGWLNYQNKKFTESVEYYQKAIGLLPLSIEAKLGIVYPLAALEKWDTVMDQYKAILKIDEYHATANYRMALIYFNRADYVTAWQYMERYVNLFPFDFDGVSLAGWIKQKEGKPEEAKVFFLKALLLHPDDVTIKNAIGLQ